MGCAEGIPDCPARPGPRGLKQAIVAGPFDDADVRNIDAALKQVLRQFAIDPDKIALTGFSYGGSYALFLGRHNLDVFSRIASLSPTADWGGTGPQDTTTEFAISTGIGDAGEIMQVALRTTQELRGAGHLVKPLLGLRTHRRLMGEDGQVWRWLRESWAMPDTAARSASDATAGPSPILTTDALERMTTFWQSLAREPDSVQAAVFDTIQAHELVPVAVGRPRMWVSNVADLPAIVATYPSVAADLERANLTAEQVQTYRAAFISARATRQSGAVRQVALASALAKNVAFVGAHETKVMALEMLMGIRTIP